MTQPLSAANEWKQLPSMPMGMGNFLALADGHDLLIAGGIAWKNDTKLWLDGVWRFDAKRAAWLEAGKLEHPLAYSAFAQTKDRVFLSGGSDGKITRSDFAEFTSKPGLKKISKVEHPRVYSAATICASKLFVISGGSDVVNLKTLTNSCYSIELNSGKVEALPEYPGGNLLVPTAAAVGETIYTFTGGYIDASGQAVNVDSAFAYNTKDRTWKKIKSYPLAVRGLSSCPLDDRYILLAGGYTNGFTDIAYLYDTTTDSYLKTKPLPYAAMITFVKHGDSLYCLGGEDRMRHRSDLFYVTSCKGLLQDATAH